jgi:uncharacterized protein (TIGR02300 family)
VAKPEWGKKHICTSCGAPFYDLKRKEIVCPSCGEELKQTTSRSRAAAAEPRPVPKETAKPAVAEAEGIVVDDDIEIDEEEDVEDAADDAEDDDMLEEDSALIGEDEDENLEALDDDTDPA